MKPGNMQEQKIMDRYAKFSTPAVETLSPANARNLPTLKNAVEVMALEQPAKAAPEPALRISHILIPGPAGDILARVYTPEGTSPLPVLVYFHGGGWVIANLDVYEPSCRALANAAGCIIVSVAYRQAPENKFPAAVDDAFAALQWVMKNTAKLGGDPKRVAVGGESAGGNRAAVTCLMARETGRQMPVAQLLVYPITNYAFDTPSYKEHADAKPLNAAMMRWFFKHYLRSEADGADPHVSPLRASDLSGLPTATIITAEIDPLCSEGEAYAKRLADAGVRVNTKRYEGVTHEFFGLAGVVDEAKEAVAYAARGLMGQTGSPKPGAADMSREPVGHRVAG